MDPGGPEAPLPPICEAPDYILRPKLHIVWADQSWGPPPWPNPGSITDFLLGSNAALHFPDDLEVLETMDITLEIVIPTSNMKWHIPGKIS